MSCVCLRSVPPPKEVIGKPLPKYLSESPETFDKFISECGGLIMGRWGMGLIQLDCHRKKAHFLSLDFQNMHFFVDFLSVFISISGHAWDLFCHPTVVDLDWMLGAYQSHPVTPLLNWKGDRKHNERLEGQDKGREIIYQLQSWAKPDLIYGK